MNRSALKYFGERLFYYSYQILTSQLNNCLFLLTYTVSRVQSQNSNTIWCGSQFKTGQFHGMISINSNLNTCSHWCHGTPSIIPQCWNQQLLSSSRRYGILPKSRSWWCWIHREKWHAQTRFTWSGYGEILPTLLLAPKRKHCGNQRLGDSSS